MKRTEVAMIVLIASLSMMVTFALVQSLLGDTIKRKVQVEKAVTISEEVATPSKRIFNDQAINPTVEVCVESASEEGASDDAACEDTDASKDAQPADATPDAEAQQQN